MKLLIDGQEVGVFDDRQTLAVFAEQDGIDLDAAGVTIELSPNETKAAIRGRIHNEVADPESLLGTTADAAAMNLLAASIVVQVLAVSGSKPVKEGLNAALGGQLVPLTASFIAQVESGEIKLPALTKGIENTLADIAERSTGVANVLEQALGASSSR